MRHTVRANFTAGRILLFLAAWTAARLAGFLATPPRIMNIDTRSLSDSLGRGTGHLFLGFVIGSIMFSFIDHKMGTDPPIDLRILHMAAGAFLMILAVLGWRVLMAGG